MRGTFEKSKSLYHLCFIKFDCVDFKWMRALTDSRTIDWRGL